MRRPHDDGWRFDPALGGHMRAITEIGTHWVDPRHALDRAAGRGRVRRHRQFLPDPVPPRPPAHARAGRAARRDRYRGRRRGRAALSGRRHRHRAAVPKSRAGTATISRSKSPASAAASRGAKPNRTRSCSRPAQDGGMARLGVPAPAARGHVRAAVFRRLCRHGPAPRAPRRRLPPPSATARTSPACARPSPKAPAPAAGPAVLF